MKDIKNIRCFLIGFFIISLLILFTFFILKIIHKQNIFEVVKSGLITIDYESHKWNLCYPNHIDDNPVIINLYVRNRSKHLLKGTLVFLVTLSKKGIDYTYIQEVIKCSGYDKEKLLERLKEEKRKYISLKKFDAVYNYLNRGGHFPKGKNYEPYLSVNNIGDYIFKFRKKVILKSGEIINIKQKVHIPKTEKGFLMSIKIENIEL